MYQRGERIQGRQNGQVFTQAQSFSDTITTRNTQQIRANLSAILRIEAWNVERRLEVPVAGLGSMGPP